MAELHRLEETGFKGQAVVNFDGKMVKDITTTEHRMLDDLEIDEFDVAALKSVAAKISEA